MAGWTRVAGWTRAAAADGRGWSCPAPASWGRVLSVLRYSQTHTLVHARCYDVVRVCQPADNRAHMHQGASQTEHLKRTCVRTHARSHTHACTQVGMYIHMYAHALINTFTHTHTHTRTRTHTHTHARTHTHLGKRADKQTGSQLRNKRQGNECQAVQDQGRHVYGVLAVLRACVYVCVHGC